jgi:hypothetical protein
MSVKLLHQSDNSNTYTYEHYNSVHNSINRTQYLCYLGFKGLLYTRNNYNLQKYK